jgi:MerR family regulatory protein
MAKKLTKYQQWYQANKEEVAKRRKERYHRDKKYREQSLKVSREWRKKNRPWENRPRVERNFLLIGEFAQHVGCSPETIRNLERKNLIPRTTDGVQRRRYSPKNVYQVSRLVTLRKELHYTDPKFADKQAAMVSRIKTTWKAA